MRVAFTPRDGFEIVSVALHGRLDNLAAGSARHHGINNEAALAGNGIQSGCEQSAANDVNQLSGAAGHKNLFLRKMVALRCQTRNAPRSEGILTLLISPPASGP